MSYLTHCIDKGLGITPSEATNHIGLSPRDKGWEFARWNRASDQSLPSLLLGVDGDGWIGETSCRIKIRREWRQGCVTTIGRGPSVGNTATDECGTRDVFDSGKILI